MVSVATTLPVRVDHGDLHAGAEARVEAHRGAGAGRRGEQQVAQVGGEDPDRLVLGRLPQPHPQVDAEVRPGSGCARPSGRCRAASCRPGGPGRRCRTGAAIGRSYDGRAAGGSAVGSSGSRVEVEDLLLLAAEHRQDAVRGQLGERLGEVEVVGELRARLLLALADLGDQPARASTSARAASPIRSASSANRSTRIARAPSSAAAASATPLSGVDERRPRRPAGRASGRPSSASASGSSPASRAICALVRRFGLYGR